MSTTVVATAVTTASTITIPSSGTQAGDLAILFDDAINTNNTPAPDDVIPTGWTGLATNSGTAAGFGFRTRISYKILEAGDLGAVVTGMNDNAEAKRLLVIRPTRPITSVLIGTLNWQVTTGDPSLQTVTPPGASEPMLIVGGVYTELAGTLTASPSGSTLDSGSTANRINYRLYDASAVSTTFDVGDTGAWNVLWSTYIRWTLAPATITADPIAFALTVRDAGPRHEQSDPIAFAATIQDAGLVYQPLSYPTRTVPYRAKLGMFPDAAVLALARPAVVCTILARLHLYDGIARLHPGVGDLTVDGETFHGVTDPGRLRLVQFEAIEEPRVGVASAVRITMTGCDTAWLRAVRADYLRMEGRQCDLLFGLWDPETEALVAAVPFFPSGRMTAPGMRFAAPGVRDFFFTVEGMWSARNFATAGTMSPADQRRRFPGDTALDLVGGTVSVRWPIDET